MVRKDAALKVTGQAKYAADYISQGILFAKIITSNVAHGIINKIDTSKAEALEGVKKVVVGSSDMKLTGVLLQDRPILAFDRVRYYGEPVAIVIANSEEIAENAADLIEIDITELTIVDSLEKALQAGVTLIHPNSTNYSKLVDDIYPEVGSNIASSYKIRKGNIDEAFNACSVIVEEQFSLPQSNYGAMEIRATEAELKADGTISILTSSQSPYTIKKLIAGAFDIEEGKVVVEVPFVGGGFGGKSTVFFEYIAVLAALYVPGKRIRIINDREQDIFIAPSRLGLEAKIKIGANSEGDILAADMKFVLDCGAYSDISPNMSKAIAVDCTGPYQIDNLSCDSLCVYTNHVYATAFRGFAHESYTFCIERMIDKLANKLNISPIDIRYKNALQPGDMTPTQVQVNSSNMGNISECIKKLRELINYDEGNRIDMGNNIIRAKGVACLWKTPNPTTNASAGAVITFNNDGSINLNVAVVEMGNSGINHLAEILAKKLRMPYERINVNYNINTKNMPEYWKTVASLSNFLAGKAVMNAAEDLIKQLKEVASIALRTPVDDLDYGEEKVFVKSEPKFCIGFQDLAFGLTTDDGNTIGGQIIGIGSYIMRHLGKIAEDNGKGKVGHAWTVGAQAVEVEVDLKDYSYKLLKASTVIDIGAVVNYSMAVSMIQGGMSMGLSLAKDEEYIYSDKGEILNTSFRTYKMLHIGEEPQYKVEFVTTPQIDAPFGVRSYSEHGIIAIPAALGNALSIAVGVDLNTLPLTPEKIWKKVEREKNKNV